MKISRYARNDKGGAARNDRDEVALEMTGSLSFHLRMPLSGGIAESRYDNYDLWDNLIKVKIEPISFVYSWSRSWTVRYFVTNHPPIRVTNKRS